MTELKEHKTKSRSSELWYTEEDRIRRAEGNDPHKWKEDYYETMPVAVLWNRWSRKVADQIEAYDRDRQMGVSDEILEARADLILDLLEDLKIEKKSINGRPYLAMKRRFL